MKSLLTPHTSDPNNNPSVRIAWEMILQAIEDRYVTLEMVNESLESLEKGGASWDEFGIMPCELAVDCVEVHYGRYANGSVSCDKKDFLEFKDLVQS